MKTVGIRELKERTSAILREVQEGSIVDVTSRGEVIARLIPVQQHPVSSEELQMIVDDLDSLSAEISARWPEGLSVQEVMDDVGIK